MESLEYLRHVYGRILRICGLIAGVLTFAVMCLVVANVALRYSINAPVAGTLELTEGALPLIVFLSLALTQYNGGHIKVVLLTQNLPATPQRVLSVIAMLAGALLFGWAAYAGWLTTAKSIAIGEIERGSIRYPVWPIKAAVCFGMLLLTIQFLLDALTLALGGTLNEPHTAEQA
jgi:TRAP-type C4-dicarboxylate transport system permease small subunit